MQSEKSRMPDEQANVISVTDDASNHQPEFNKWLEFGKSLYDKRKEIEWRCADWLAEGQQKFPNQMSLVLPMLATDIIEQKKLNHCAKVASSIPIGQRCAALTFAHHMHVADLPLTERITLLDQAAKDNVSARAFRIIVNDRKAAIGAGNLAIADDDWEYKELMDIIRSWNRGRPDARQSFLDMANAANLNVIAA